ncbi:MAG: hypothetical protein LBD48_01145 [Treponema sp.]|nr:hypothetical protein [Treponema sp.]
MKRVFFAIFVLCLAGLAWAQEVKIGNGTLEFGGKVAGGVFFDFDDVPQEDDTGQPIAANRNAEYSWFGPDGRVRMWNESDTKTGLRGELTATYTNGIAGMRVRFRSDWDGQHNLDGDAIGRYAYGWFNLFDEALKFTGGFIDLSDNVWGTLGEGDWDIGGAGLRVEFKPFNITPLRDLGLGDFNIGAFLLVPWKADSGDIHDENLVVIADGRFITLQKVLEETAFGFRWTHPWFYAGTQLRLDSTIDGIEIKNGLNTKLWSGAGDEMCLMFGAGFTMLPELKLSVEGNFEGLGNWEARGTGDLRQTVEYTFSRLPVDYLDRLFIGVKAKELLWGYDLTEFHGMDWDFDLKPWIQFKPYIGYNITSQFSAALEFGFASGYWKINNKNPSEDPRTWNNEASHFHIKPNLTYNFKNGLELKAWYMFTEISYDNLGESSIFTNRNYYTLPKKEDNLTLIDSIKRHQLALEFVWSF